MAEGVRFHHPTLRGVMYVVPHTRRLKVPHLCPMCNVTHVVKTYHLALDNEGDVIVSQQIAARLKQLPDNGGLLIENPVSAPPKQTLSLDGLGEFRIVEYRPSKQESNRTSRREGVNHG